MYCATLVNGANNAELIITSTFNSKNEAELFIKYGLMIYSGLYTSVAAFIVEVK